MSETPHLVPLRHRWQSRRLMRMLIAVVLVSVSLAYIEAVIVADLRHSLIPLRNAHFPEAADGALPLLSAEQLTEAGHEYSRLVLTEIIREPVPIVLLLAVAWAIRRRRGEMLGAFLLSFALWDIFYYVFLRALVGWPASVHEWDVLYLIPVAWVAPVWAPLLVSALLAAAGVAFIYVGPFAARRRRYWPAAPVAAGFALILLSFILRTSEAFRQVPERFDWPCFLAGWVLSAVGFVLYFHPLQHKEVALHPNVQE